MMRRFFVRLTVVLLGAGLATACLAADTMVAGTPPTNEASVALSPDGLTLAVTGRHEGRKHLWLKPVGSGAARPLPGTVDASFPFWSPDGRKLGFFAADEMRQIDIASGKVTTILPRVTYASGASWGKDGVILFSTAGQYIIWQIPETGGGQRPAATLDGPDQFSLSRPHFLPDGINFLFYAQGREGERGIYQGILGTDIKRRLIDSESAGVFASGKLYYTQNGVLHARSLDPVLGLLGNDDQVIARNVATGSPAAAPVTSNGQKVAYRIGNVSSGKQLVWYDRAGKSLGNVGEPFSGGGGPLSLSPDGKSALLNYVREGNTDIGIVDLATGRITPVSVGPESDLDELWSNDGASVLFSSKRTATIEMYQQQIGKPLDPDKVISSVDLRRPMDMTRDGRYLFYRKNTPDLWVFDQQTKQEIQIIRPGTAPTHWPGVSPDGRWIAVQSYSTGSMQIHLHGPFAPPALGTTSKPLTTNGGGWPRWRGDGKELFYVEADGSLMSISLSYSGDGSSFTASNPVKLFTPPINSSPVNAGAGPQFAVTPDGQRFLVITSPEFENPVYVHED
jgi:eukaryotic-like serine/threonine-protein kinase